MKPCVNWYDATLVPWNCMGFCDIWYGDSRVPTTFIQNPLEGLGNLMSFKLAITKFHGIPWNCSWKSKGTWCLLERQTSKFHGIPLNMVIFNLEAPEFHGIPLSSWVAYETAPFLLHGSMKLQNQIWTSSMEFHRTLGLLVFDLTTHDFQGNTGIIP